MSCNLPHMPGNFTVKTELNYAYVQKL